MEAENPYLYSSHADGYLESDLSKIHQSIFEVKDCIKSASLRVPWRADSRSKKIFFADAFFDLKPAVLSFR